MTARPLLRAVGVLESCFGEKFGAPRQPRLVPASTALLKIKKEFHPVQSLRGLEGFSHVWLLSYFHLNAHERFVPIVHPPRLGGAGVGVFASRSPHRPSPVGLSLARLVRVAGDTLHLAEVDLTDGTPIIDVKPYIPAYDLAARPRAGWAAAASDPRLAVRLTAEARRQVRAAEKGGVPGLSALIRQVLARDLRNPRDRSQLIPGRELSFWLHRWDVVFKVEGGVATVQRLAPVPDYKRAKRRPPPL